MFTTLCNAHASNDVVDEDACKPLQFWWFTRTQDYRLQVCGPVFHHDISWGATVFRGVCVV